MYLCYEDDIASGAAIVLLSAGVFAVADAGTTARRVLRSESRPLPEPRNRWPVTRVARADEHL